MQRARRTGNDGRCDRLQGVRIRQNRLAWGTQWPKLLERRRLGNRRRVETLSEQRRRSDRQKREGPRHYLERYQFRIEHDAPYRPSPGRPL